MRREDLLYVSWSLTPEDEGVVIVHYTDGSGREATERYGLSGASPRSELPDCVADVVDADGRRSGAWYG